MPLTVHFDGSLSTDPDGDHLLYSWNLGDGVIEQGASVRHTFPRCGLHQVTLTALDPGGAASTARKILFVRVTSFAGRQEQ